MAVSRQPRPQEARDRSLIEMMRVMDVAREVRKSRRPAEHALVDREFRAELRENLLRTARQAGDPADASDIEAAIDAYLTNRNVYTDPPWSFSVILAHLWVLRRGLLYAAAVLLIGVLILWLLSVLYAATV